MEANDLPNARFWQKPLGSNLNYARFGLWPNSTGLRILPRFGFRPG